jgi:phage tail sheath protein FI
MALPQSYPRPGAYINEQLLPLTTSGNNVPGQAVAAFANAYNIGPTIPTFCSSWQSFISNYGTFAQANGNPLHFAVYSYFVNGGLGCYVLRVPNTDATSAHLALQDLGSATVFTATAAQQQVVSQGAWGNQVYVEIVALNAITTHFNINIYYVPVGSSPGPSFLVETFLNVSTNPADTRYVLNIVNSPVSGSNYIQLTGGLTYSAGVTDFQPITPTALAGGADGSSSPSGTFAATVQVAFDNYATTQILNLNIPGGFNAAGSMNSNTIINTLVAWAAAREDVFVLVDGPLPSFPETSAAVVTNYTNMITGGSSVAPSSFVGIYGPYLLVQDPSSANVGATRYISPSGSLLGMWNFTDNLVGVNQVAAGTQFGQISCLGLEVYFSPTDLNNLFPINVNAIKKIPGYGFCAFGARTLLQGYPSMYIPIRRTLMKIEHDATVLTQFAMFQPNAPKLWQNITTVLTNYLNTITLAGLLGSQNPAQAYSITCNGTNNTPQSAQAGQVNISIAVALGSPVEIIVINISQLTQGTITSSSPSGTSQ